jgi:ankyrin repeat protein
MKNCRNSNIQALSFLFKKNDQWEYWFIHKDFEIYFLLKYIQNNSENIDQIINLKDNNWKTLFMYACEYGNIEVVNIFINKWVNINEKDNNWITAFILSCHKWYSEIAKLLSDKIDNINEKPNNWMTAFVGACCRGHLEIVNLLIKR